VLLDEASLAGTLTLDQLTTEASAAGAKIVLVGDWAQLGAIDAGGAFHLLATRRPETPELRNVRRFTEPWEADASTALRAGDLAAIDAYLAHDRIRAGARADMLHALFDAWRHDTDRGLNSAMIAPDDASVAALNALAQAHRRDTGQAKAGSFVAADGHQLGIGDTIVTRRNDRRLRTGTGWVKNGDTWIVTVARADGALLVRDETGREAALPSDYVRAHVELGYATTVHRAQGSTVDTAHALITATTTREALYVAATRARTSNRLYVDTTEDPDLETSHGGGDMTTGRAALTAAINRSAADASAHAVLAAQVDADGDATQHRQDRPVPAEHQALTPMHLLYDL
jgi:ATP-dependent exoDNAse (exonuclease V) alpha subunit